MFQPTFDVNYLQWRQFRNVFTELVHNVLHILLQKKLDRSTHAMYEQSLTQSQIRQLFSQFLAFLEIGFQTLGALGNKVRPSGAQCETHPLKKHHIVSTAMIASGGDCNFCKGAHKLFACAKFLSFTSTHCLEHVKKLNLCVNCLASGHRAAKCPEQVLSATKNTTPCFIWVSRVNCINSGFRDPNSI